MARPLRIEYAGAWYHVMNRGLGKRNIFLSDQDQSHFFDLLGEISQIFKIELHAYSLMDNHYHLLIHTPQKGLSRAMRHLNGVYTQKFNWLHHTDGPLFRGRYKALLVDSDKYLLELVRYIHLNPVKAGICENVMEHPWTSHRAYLRESSRPEWLVREKVLSRFGSKENRALKEMSLYINAGVSKDFQKILDKQGVILGSKVFQKWVYDNFGDGQKNEKEIPIKNRKWRPTITPRQILDGVAYAYSVGVSDLRKSQRGQTNEARNVAAYFLRQMGGLRQSDIAMWLKCSNGYAVATIQRRLRGRLAREKKFRKYVEAVSRTVLS